LFGSYLLIIIKNEHLEF